MKPSDCEDKLRSVPELFNVTDSILLIFALSLKICVPAESTNESVPVPPFKVSELASPAAATVNVSTPEPPVKISVPAPPIKLNPPEPALLTLMVAPLDAAVKLAVPAFVVLEFAVKLDISLALAVAPDPTIKTSLELKSVIVSVPPPTLKVSTPCAPVRVSFPVPPLKVSLPAPPRKIRFSV